MRTRSCSTGVFVFAGARGYLAIRRREIERHREWMTRMYAIAVGIGMVRLVAFPITFGFPRMDPALMLMVTFWVGWLLMVAGAELWIRYARASSEAIGPPPRPSSPPRPALRPPSRALTAPP